MDGPWHSPRKTHPPIGTLSEGNLFTGCMEFPCTATSMGKGPFIGAVSCTLLWGWGWHISEGRRHFFGILAEHASELEQVLQQFQSLADLSGNPQATDLGKPSEPRPHRFARVLGHCLNQSRAWPKYESGQTLELTHSMGSWFPCKD